MKQAKNDAANLGKVYAAAKEVGTLDNELKQSRAKRDEIEDEKNVLLSKVLKTASSSMSLRRQRN